MMSDRKRKWWIRAKADPEQYKKTIAKISKNNAKNMLGKTGKLNPNWKGGRYIDGRDGYVVVVAPPNHPHFKKGGGGGTITRYILEHRLVMEKILGRYLLPEEEVHHKNSIKHDNRPKNLMLVSHMAHFQEHGCPQCGFKLFTK